ncbi:MAG: hypothetical protein FJX74_10020, partial [Armatimonadetes bacterium]|nr:hypothetical protein [Armatimonadota bacterium]
MDRRVARYHNLGTREGTMGEWTSKVGGILDGHVHMGGPDGEGAVLSLCEATRIERMALVAIQNP